MSVNKAQTDEEPDNLAAAAKGKVVSAMMRKHLVEGIVPVMVELKRLLEARRNPLLTQLMATMRVLLKEHKSEASIDGIRMLLFCSPILSSHFCPFSCSLVFYTMPILGTILHRSTMCSPIKAHQIALMRKAQSLPGLPQSL